MKGTAPRSADPAEDDRLRAWLLDSVKERAENLMIVDLLRNNIARVALPGTVQVPRLFEVERYPTLHQMTSTVRARALPHISALDVLRATFPCGSVTGAPKVRAMEIIQAIERRNRRAYTGSMGFVEPCGTAAFNVLIRTLELTGGEAELGLGSAIVAGSTPDDEWKECALKATFLRQENAFRP